MSSELGQPMDPDDYLALLGALDEYPKDVDAVITHLVRDENDLIVMNQEDQGF